MNYLTSIIIIIIISHYNVIASNPLLTAILRNDRTTAHGIIANPKTNVNEKINDGKFGVTQPLQYAIQWGRTDIIKYLLDRKDLAINEPFDVGSFQGNITPLQLAFSPTQKEVIKTLLTSPNIDLNVQIDGKPLLSHILQMQLKDYQSIIKAILAHKNFRVSMLYQKDSQGRTPIDWAKSNKNDEVIKLFKDKEASMNKDNTSKNIASNANIYRYLSSSNKLSSTKDDYTSKTHGQSKLFEHKAKKLSSTNKDDTSKVSINHAEKNTIPNKLASTNKDDTSKTHGQSKLELDSPYYKKRHEFLNKPETKQKELKTELVVKELHQFQKHNTVPTRIKWHSLDIDERCVFIWTTGAYTRINKALREDKDNDGLNYWMPCIAGIVNYLKKTKSKEIISYRGTSIPIMQEKLYKLYSKEKELVTVVNFLSTSKVERGALNFPLQKTNEGYVKVLFVITVPENAVAADIENLSNHKYEEEVLLKPYTVFRVNKYITEGKPRPYIYVEIVDCTKNDCSRALTRHM